MILLDASVIIDALRTKDIALMSRLASLGGAVCGVTPAEVLSGARGSADRSKIVTILDAFHQVSIPQSLWDLVGDAQAQLRAGGVTVPFSDAVLVAVALAIDSEIWAHDVDFVNAQRVLPHLKLYAP
jgi:predicted nucleic acid-binding protein